MMTRQRPASTPFPAAVSGEVTEGVVSGEATHATDADRLAVVEAASAARASQTHSNRRHNSHPLPIHRLPTIQFVAEHDTHSNRPSLQFTPISRTLPTTTSVIRVGRFSERDCPENLPPNVPSEAPVGFRSKVVSRKHCIFFYTEGQWWIKDVKSSSGTFLNHIRLSQPNNESKPFPIKDGDILQLGIDFKGGEEMIYRCVKVRIQCNRGWQKGLNNYNKNAHKALQDLARAVSGDNSESKQSTECTICLNSIAPCQPLFVAPCSHTWHYKCIRPLIENPKHPHFQYPLFLCPNCRAVNDLEADIEDPVAWDGAEQQEAHDESEDGAEAVNGRSRGAQEVVTVTPPAEEDDENPQTTQDVPGMTTLTISDQPPHLPPVDILTPTTYDLLEHHQARQGAETEREHGSNRDRTSRVAPAPPSSSHRATQARRRSASSVTGVSTPFHLNLESSGYRRSSEALEAGGANSDASARLPSSQRSNSTSSEGILPDTGPLTPRNVAGPFVFDGSGVNSPRTSRDGGSGGRG